MQGSASLRHTGKSVQAGKEELASWSLCKERLCRAQQGTRASGSALLPKAPKSQQEGQQPPFHRAANRIPWTQGRCTPQEPCRATSRPEEMGTLRRLQPQDPERQAALGNKCPGKELLTQVLKPSRSQGLTWRNQAIIRK